MPMVFGVVGFKSLITAFKKDPFLSFSSFILLVKELCFDNLKMLWLTMLIMYGILCIPVVFNCSDTSTFSHSLTRPERDTSIPINYLLQTIPKKMTFLSPFPSVHLNTLENLAHKVQSGKIPDRPSKRNKEGRNHQTPSKVQHRRR